jgi:predicted unusual protein kinase regulating ubiquinone biosynthesis (AarF/ABC1/UbiB family)
MFQTYFLKRMLNVLDASDEVRVAEFDRLISSPIYPYSVNNLTIDAKNPPDLVRYTQSPYHRLGDEIKFRAQIYPPRVDSFQINNETEFKAINDQARKFLDMDFGIPMKLLAPRVYEIVVKRNVVEYARRSQSYSFKPIESAADKQKQAKYEQAGIDAFNEIFVSHFGRLPKLNFKSGLTFGNRVVGVDTSSDSLSLSISGKTPLSVLYEDYELFKNGKSKDEKTLEEIWRNLKIEKLREADAEYSDYLLAEHKKHLVGSGFEEFLKRNDDYLPKDRGQYYFFADLFGLDIASDGREDLIKLPKKEKRKIIREITEMFETNIKKLRNISSELIRSGNVKFENSADQRFFELLLSEYYSEIPREMAKNVLKKLIESPDKNSPMDIFRHMVLYSGPQMQKLLQVLGRNEGFSPELRKVFGQVEENGLEFPWEQIAHKFTDPPVGYEWVSLNRQSFVGTMAQTYFGIVRDRNGNSVEIAARTLKPGIADELAEEKPRLEKLARTIDQDPLLRRSDFPLITPILQDVEEMAKEELDVGLTENRQRQGEKYKSTVKNKDGLQIEFITPETLNSSQNGILYSTWLPGEKFDSFQEKYPVEAVAVAEAIAEKWIETAFFSELFFHADLHQGNMKIRRISATQIQVGFLDFGMAATIDQASKSLLVRLGIELVGKCSARGIAEYIWQLSDSSQNLVSYSKFVEEIEKRLPKDNSRSIAAWLRWSLSKGIKLKKNINAFSRGLCAIEQLLIAGKSAFTASDLMLKVARSFKWDLTKLGASYLKDQIRPSLRIEEIQKGPISCRRIFSQSN